MEDGPMTPGRFVRLMKEFPKVNDLDDYERVGRHLGINFRLEANGHRQLRQVLVENHPQWLEGSSYYIGDTAGSKWKHISLRLNKNNLCVTVDNVWATFGDKPFLHQKLSPDDFPRYPVHPYYGFLYMTPEGWGVNFDFNRELCLRSTSISIKINR